MIKRSTLFALDWLAGALGMGMLFVALLFVRMAAAPFELNDFGSVLTDRLSDPVRGITASVGNSSFVWDRATRRIHLNIDSLILKNSADHVIITVPHAEAELRVLPLLIGRVAFQNARAAGANINMERSNNGQLTLLGVAPQAKVNTDPEFPLSALLAEWPQRIAKVQSQLERIGNLSITASQLTIVDRAENQTIDANMPSLTMAAEDETVHGAGLLTVNIPNTAPLQVTLDMRLFPGRGTGETIISFDNVNPATIGRLDQSLMAMMVMDMPVKGYINVTYTPDGMMQMTFGAESMAAGKLMIPNLPEPLTVDSFNLNASAVATGNTSFNQATINKIELKRGGATLSITGMLAMGDNVHKRDIDLNAVVTNLPMNDVQAMWPVTAAVDARLWVVPNMRDGMVSNATFALAGDMKWPSLEGFDYSKLGGSITLENATIDYYHPLVPATAVKAFGTYDDKKITIRLDEGRVGAMTLKTGGTVVIDGLSDNVQTIATSLPLAGPLAEVLTVVNSPPFEYANKVGIAPTSMKGDTDFVLKISLPLLDSVKLEEIKLDAQGTVKNFANNTLVPVFNLTQGDLAFKLDTTQLKITGPVAANSAKVNVDWLEVFSPAATAPSSIATITSVFGQDDLKNIGAPLPGTVEGKIPATVTYKGFGNQPDQLVLDADLAPVKLDLPRLTFNKPKGAKGKVAAKAEINEGAISVTEMTATAAGMNIAGTAQFTKDGTLAALKLAPLVIGQNDARVDYAREGEALPKITIRGKRMNLGALTESGETEEDVDKQADAARYDMSMELDRAVFAIENRAEGIPEKFFAPFKLRATHDAINNMGVWKAISLNTQAGGAVPFTATLQPTQKGQSLLVETPDFGRVVRALDWSDDIIGGALRVEGSGTGVGDPIIATVNLTDYRVLDLPFMARLLNTLSLDGLLALTRSDNGLEFKKLKGTLIVKGDELRFKDLRTSGGSLGLTAEGSMNTATNQIDMQGTVVPFSSANKVLGAIPLIGHLLTGGEGGGLFAATYSAKGKLNDPNFSVNPLSVLAPGILRNIFFVD